MPINPTLWSEAFHRASRETIGIALHVTQPRKSMELLHKFRPADPVFRDYTVTRPPTPNLIFIIKPGVTLDEDQLALVRGDTSPPDLED